MKGCWGDAILGLTSPEVTGAGGTNVAGRRRLEPGNWGAIIVEVVVVTRAELGTLVLLVQDRVILHQMVAVSGQVHVSTIALSLTANNVIWVLFDYRQSSSSRSRLMA